MGISPKSVLLLAGILLLEVGLAWSSTGYDRIRVILNDQVITQNEIDVRVLEFIQQNGGSASALPEQAETIRSRIIDLLIEEALLDIRADELQIQLTEDQLDAEVDHYRSQQRLNQLEFEELLERRNLTLADFKSRYLKQTRRRAVIDQEIRTQINIPEETLKALYESGAAASVQIRARHILLILAKDASAEETAGVRSKMLQLREEIISGKPFSEMADQYSQDPTVKLNHGDLGFFGRGDMVPEFANAAFSQQPGILSEPIRTQFGFHLIEVIERREDTAQSFTTVREKLYRQEYHKQFENLYKTYIAGLKKKARIIHR